MDDLYDEENFADAFYQASTELKEKREIHGKILNDFIMANDIER